jgi:uncharacterized protein involved in outer membrane biogenesis
MNNVLLLLGALLVGILAALLAVPMVVDWNSYRGVFEEEASRVMGRDVRLSGPINVRILPVPYVQFERLRIADPSSTGGDSLFRADNLTMRLSIGPLLRGVVEAQHVALKRPSLRLAVDGDGGGNWRSLSLKPGALAFLPADVSLPSVEIAGGLIQLVGVTGQEIAQFEAIDGEFSAEGLEGPYKFKGNTTWYGAAREVRISTAKPEPDGSVRLKTSMRIPANQNTYLFDGRIIDWNGRARLEGDLTAKLPLANPVSAMPTDKNAALPEASVFELKSRLTADLTGGKLTDVALALDQVGDPQLITGDASFVWGQKPRFDMALASRSLNLDRFSPPTTATHASAADPLGTAHAVLNVVLAALPAQADTEAKLKAERVTLAGDTLTGVSLAMSRRGGILEVRDLRALLPGQTRLEVSGTVSRETQSFGFEGPIALRGAHLARFLTWARKEGALKEGQSKPTAPVTASQIGPARYDGPFALEGRIATTPTTFELTRVVGEFADTPISGDIKISREARQKIVLLLEGPKLDFAEIWPGGLDMERLRKLLLGAKPANGESKAQPTAPQLNVTDTAGLYGFNPDTTDIKVELRTGALQTTRTTQLRDVDAAFSVERGKIAIKRVRFTTPGSLAVDIEGQTNSPPGGASPSSATSSAPTPILPIAGQHRGSYRWVVDAPNAAALDEALTALDWPLTARPSPSVLAALGSVRLAGSALQGERVASALDITADGTLDGGRINVAAKIDAGNSGWRFAPIDVLVDLETSNLDRWISLLAAAGETSPQRALKPRSGKILLKTKGEPQSGVTILAIATGDGLSMNYHGSGNLEASGNLSLNGTADVVANEANDLLILAQLPLGQGATGLSFQGQIDVDTRDGNIKLATELAKFGPSTVRGNLSWIKAAQSATARTLTGAVAIDRATLAGLACSICDRRNAAASGPLKTSVWPDQPIVWSDLAAWTGRVALAIGNVTVEGPLGLKNATANLTIGPDTIAVSDIVGTTYGGRVTGQITLAKSSAGTDLTGALELNDADLKALQSGASGPFALTAKVAGQGLSPSGLVAGLQGRADVALGPTRLTGLAPAALAATIDQAYEGKLPVEGEVLLSALRTGLSKSTLDLEKRTVAIAIKDGVARAAALVQATTDGKATGDATLDLNQLRTTSDWRIEAAARGAVAGAAQLAALPAVQVTTTGTLAKPDADSKLVTSAFEQELVVRKMERDVQELERLRLLDEERQRAEAERSRLEAERDRQETERVKAESERGKAEAERLKAQQGWAPVEGAGQSPTPTQTNPQPATPAGATQSAIGAQTPPPDTAAASTAPAIITQPPRPSGLTRAPGSNPSSPKRRAQEGVPSPFQKY